MPRSHDPDAYPDVIRILEHLMDKRPPSFSVEISTWREAQDLRRKYYSYVKALRMTARELNMQGKFQPSATMLNHAKFALKYVVSVARSEITMGDEKLLAAPIVIWTDKTRTPLMDAINEAIGKQTHFPSHATPSPMTDEEEKSLAKRLDGLLPQAYKNINLDDFLIDDEGVLHKKEKESATDTFVKQAREQAKKGKDSGGDA